MIVGLMRMKAGTGAEPHSHPNEQWIYVLEGTFHANINRERDRREAGLSSLYSRQHSACRQGDSGRRRGVTSRSRTRHTVCTASKLPEQQRSGNGKNIRRATIVREKCMKRLIALLFTALALSAGAATAPGQIPQAGRSR